MPAWLGWLTLPIGGAQLVGALEFVGPNEREGWPTAGRVTPIAYIAWSLWLIVCGVALLRSEVMEMFRSKSPDTESLALTQAHRWDCRPCEKWEDVPSGLLAPKATGGEARREAG